MSSPPDGTRCTSELVDVPKLAAWLDAEGFPGAGEELTVEVISGGTSNALFSIHRGGRSWVLRRPPKMAPQGRNATMVREVRILSALSASDVPHPRVRGLCTDVEVLGATFYVMDRVEGWSPVGRRAWPAPFDSDPIDRRALAFELVDAAARLGVVDWRWRDLDGIGRPEGFHERQVGQWLAHLRACQGRGHP